jgi:hypothetical protein
MRTLKTILVNLMLLSSVSFNAKVEVLYWWISGGEAQFVNKLKKMLEKNSYTWKYFSVADEY